MRLLLISLAVLLLPVAGNATSISATATAFTGAPLSVTITADDAAAGAGEIRIELSVDAGFVGDLRGFFLDLSDASLLSGLSRWFLLPVKSSWTKCFKPGIYDGFPDCLSIWRQICPITHSGFRSPI